jgi:hypothetical protein
VNATLYRGADGASWATGAARLLVEIDVGDQTLPLAIRCRIGDVGPVHIALLDTAASWSVLPRELAQAVSAEDVGAPPLVIRSRFGRHTGSIARFPLAFVAEEGWGSDVALDARALVLDEWPGPVVLGLHGVLEVVRLALDPGAGPHDACVYFGPV